MSAYANKMALKTASELADEMLQALMPHCEPGRCVVAGSIRRQKPLVGDIEIVAIPKPGSITPFFVAASSIAKPQTRMGRESRYVKMHREVPKVGLVQYDLFLPQGFDWGRILAIRTGSAEWAAKMLASEWSKKGYCGTEHGLLPQSVCRKKDRTWLLLPETDPAKHRVEFREEEDLFTWLGFTHCPTPESRLL